MSALVDLREFDEAFVLCVRAGLPTMTWDECAEGEERRGGEPDWNRVAHHEVGHGCAYLDRAPDDSDWHIVVRPNGSGGLVEVSPPVAPPSLDDAIASELGGIVAEAVCLSAVTPWEAHVDLRRAFALAAGTDDLVRAQVDRLKATFTKHRDAMQRIAAALLEHRQLQRDQCIAIACDAGWDVEGEARLRAIRQEVASVRHAGPIPPDDGTSLFERLVAAGAEPEAQRATIAAWEAERKP